MLLNAPCVDGLKDRPTRSRGAKRPPTRSRVPWTRRTSPPWGRNPPSTSRILLGPPRTAGAWSSAPRGESGRTLTGGRQRKATFIKMHSSSTPVPFPILLLPPLPGCFYPDQHAHVAGGSAFFSVEHIAAAFTCSSSRSGPGSVALHEQRRSDSCSGVLLRC